MTEDIDARMLRVDESLAKQLERSIQRNAEMATEIAKLKKRIEIAPHEREAMYYLVLLSRALTEVWERKDADQQKNKLQSCAKIVEDLVDRCDQNAG